MSGLPHLTRRGLAREVSRIANAPVADVLAVIETTAAEGYRIGITGPPGAGKSSLIAELAKHRLKREGGLAVVAVDPTSPVSGGAILGDRIRMAELATDPRVYIRSLASRDSVDGLADNLPSVLDFLAGHGFAEILVETVGVGQVEYEVRRLVDTMVLVLIPGAGDQIQAMKAGVLETADIIVVNKADLPGAERLQSELSSVLERQAAAGGRWSPRLVKTAFNDPASFARLSEAIDDHLSWLGEGDRRVGILNNRRGHQVSSLVIRRLHEIMQNLPADSLSAPLAEIYQQVVERLFVNHAGKKGTE